MRIELEYNARSIPPADVARSFIPPTPHFGRLLSRNHTLLLGPRGSGKTTLLKMLTARALNNWTHTEAEVLAPQVTFNAAFIPPISHGAGKSRRLDHSTSKLPGRTRRSFYTPSVRSFMRCEKRQSLHGKKG
jgi:hypothetical protein